MHTLDLAPARSAAPRRSDAAGLPQLPGHLLDDHAAHHQTVAGLLGRLVGMPRPFRSLAFPSSFFGSQQASEGVA
jgi:hypothetical protein